MRIVALASFIGLVFATSANGQTSSQIATTKPAETYSYFKRALQRQRAGMDEVNGQKNEESMGLSSCSDATDYIGYDGNPNSIVAKTANLAFDVVYLQATLQVAGYPKSVWEPELFEYERTNLAEIDRYNTQKESPAKQRLAKKLNEYRKASNGRYKEVFAGSTGCGGGEVTVKISAAPPAERVQYINVVKYDLCSFQGLDPKGPRCDLWVDYNPTAKDGAMMSGRYRIRATWSDKIEYRDLDFDALHIELGGVFPFKIIKQQR
jgi:hypothetical protein